MSLDEATGRWMLLQYLTAIAFFCFIPSANTADLAPDSGMLTFRGTLVSSDGETGAFAVEALLSAGDFTGSATISIAGTVIAGPLFESRSYLENGKCILYLERGRTRFEMRGRCDSENYGLQDGGFDAFLEGPGALRGTMAGTVSVVDGDPESPDVVAVLPTEKLTCAWQETHVSYTAGTVNEYLLAYSMMVTLTLNLDGTYRTASSRGSYRLADGKVYLTSGAFSGAVGTLQRDRSGDVAIVFYKQENRTANGLPLIDPETTRCTKAK